MPPALGKLTWKSESDVTHTSDDRLTSCRLAYIIFAVLDFIGIFIIYFFAVETKVSMRDLFLGCDVL